MSHDREIGDRTELLVVGPLSKDIGEIFKSDSWRAHITRQSLEIALTGWAPNQEGVRMCGCCSMRNCGARRERIWRRYLKRENDLRMVDEVAKGNQK